MIKNMVKHGNSSALILDKPILDILKINQKTPLEITTDGTNIIISPVKNKNRVKRINSSLEKINKKYNKTLKKLAK